MPDKDDDYDNSVRRVPESGTTSAGGKQRHLLLVLFLVFVGFITFVFLTQDKSTIDWIKDYEAGLALAKQQNKPILLAIYKKQTRFCVLMTNETYKDPDVKKFVSSNFIPILIDVDEQPEVAKKYDIGYYPVHYVTDPNQDKLIGPQMGYEGAPSFIRRLKRFLGELNSQNK